MEIWPQHANDWLVGYSEGNSTFLTSENGHKIAYDPRDISESQERNKQPKLTLMEEVLLLGLKDKQVQSFACLEIDSDLKS